ncbi:MAG: S8 family serine peptidase [Candidatus Gracilibacteria bacterium]
MVKSLTSYIPVTLAVVLAVTLGFFDAQNHPTKQFFSNESLQSMRTLNFEYQIVIEDLTAPSSSPLMSELFKADVLLPSQTADRSNKGLVVTLDSSITDSKMLLLQPVKPLTDEELRNVAEAYNQVIPEFTNVELDQDVALESIIYDWELFPTEKSAQVDLSSSVDEPVKVAVIDSGIDTSHEVFASSSVHSGWNTITGDETMYDDVGHGTHIAGLIAMHAPSAEIYPYKIVDSKGGRLSNVLEAFSRAIDDDVDVINTSFGLSSQSYALGEIVEKAYKDGIIVVSASGNSGADTTFYPAYYENTIAVAGVDASNHKMPSSNFGDWVDVAAYGYHVRSALPNNLYGYKSGTSQATAIVSGAVANLLADSAVEMSFNDVLVALKASTEQIPDGELAGLAVIE